MRNEKSDRIIENAVEGFRQNLHSVRTNDKGKQSKSLARYAAVVQPNFVQWLATSIASVRSDDARAILRKNLYDEVTQDHPGMLRRFCESASVRASPDDVERSTRDLYFISGDVFSRSYATSVRQVAALALMENASMEFIPILKRYAENLGGKDIEYADVHGIADKEHAVELLDALSSEIDAQVHVGHSPEFCLSAAKIGANISAEFMLNIINSDRERYISI